MLTNQATSTITVAAREIESKRTMIVSRAEERMLERFRSTGSPTMFWVYVGGDGEPKIGFAMEDIRREDWGR